MGGNQMGNYPVANVGMYSTSLTKDIIKKIESATDEAKLHQFGACRLPGKGKDLAEKIALCLRAAMVVPIGNSVRVSGCKTDSNGVAQAPRCVCRSCAFDSQSYDCGSVNSTAASIPSRDHPF